MHFGRTRGRSDTICPRFAFWIIPIGINFTGLLRHVTEILEYLKCRRTCKINSPGPGWAWSGHGPALVGPWYGHGTAMARPGPDIVKKYQTWSTHRHWSTSLNRNQTKLPRQPIFSSVCSQMAVLIKYLGVRYTIVPTWRILTQARGQAARDRKTEPETRKQRRHLWRIFCTSINGYTNNLRFYIKYFTSLDISFILWDEYNLWVPFVRRTRCV